MKIAISGASGFVGTHLTAYLQRQGHVVVPLGRTDLAEGAEEPLARLVAPCDAVVNLAGAPINHRWSQKYKDELFASRIDTTRRLVEAVNASGNVRTFISTSAVGYYPSVGCYDEYDDEHGTGFLARLCMLWEDEARKVKARCVITRFGVILAPDGGAFPTLARSARAHIAVIAGSGLQPFSWIALNDLLRAQEFLLTHDDLKGVFNLAAPEKLTMREFMESIARHYRAWLTVRIPAFVIRMALGESSSFVLEGQCAVPERLSEAGFRFEMPTADDFLKHL